MDQASRAASQGVVDATTPDKMQPFRGKLADWAEQNSDRLASHKVSLPSDLHNRNRDLWSPLLTVAQVIDPELAELMEAIAIRSLELNSDDPGMFEYLMSDIAEILARHPGDKIRTIDLVHALHGAPSELWSAANMDERKLASMLSDSSIKPKPRQFGTSKNSKTARGYSTADFSDAIARYVK
jgi:hypothetical protein